jgi:lysyl-tRNA synthetase class 2
VHEADHAKDTMSRPSLSFLRPYLSPSTRCLRVEHASAYLSVQRRFSQIAAEKHTGPHDVEKQKRLEQLGRVRALDDYHPRLRQPQNAEKLSIRDFNAKYEAIEETKPEMVSVLGTNTAQAP